MCEHHESMSRRSLLRTGAAVAAIGLYGALGAGTAGAAPVAGGAGACGAPADDPHFASRVGAVQRMSVAAAVETSYNGWSVGTPASAIGVANYVVPGTSISIPVRSDVATVLIHLADRFNREVEGLRSGQVWGYDYRRNVNNPSVWSNHASGTAIDLNSALHPNGAKGSFTSSQVSAIRNILSFFGDVIYWGGDYRGTTDEMHFEIDVAPGDSRLKSVVAAIGDRTLSGTRVTLRSLANNKFVCADNGGASELIANRGVAQAWEQFMMINRGGSAVALRSMANNMYVCADNGGASPLIANRSSVLGWETFDLIRNSNGTVSLRSWANGKFVCAEYGGALSLRANRDVAQTWEQFQMQTV
ncbi:hypothetical protein Namu_4178 [Nakamurella multipartita DSM 44233]|uniref:Uncharacterized protein n=2 Tax=Nakamurella TaxID=53460 RepID=C8XIK2_NAKMY|nr:hypothetical protein Namu_4178 [Nakamurella multipartita DSM 44233]